MATENSPKRRGRKPKIKEDQQPQDQDPEIPRKRRGRKPKATVGTTTTPAITSATTPATTSATTSAATSATINGRPSELTPVVLYLPIRDQDFQVLASFTEEERRNQILLETPSVIQPANEEMGLVSEEFQAKMVLQKKEDGHYEWIDQDDAGNDPMGKESDENEIPAGAEMGKYKAGPSTHVYTLREKYQPTLPEHLGGGTYDPQPLRAPIMQKTVWDMKLFPLQLETAGDVSKLRDIRVSTWCWHCCHPFDSFPVYFPVSYGPIGGRPRGRRSSSGSGGVEAGEEPKNVFKVKGCFCSFNCAMAWGDALPAYFKESHALTRLMYKRLTGQTDAMAIQPAPDRYVLDSFGGCVSIEQFRASFHTLSRYILTEFPIIHIIQQIECQEPAPMSTVVPTTGPPVSSVSSGAGSFSQSKMDNAEKRLLRLKRSTKLQNPAGLDILMKHHLNE